MQVYRAIKTNALISRIEGPQCATYASADCHNVCRIRLQAKLGHEKSRLNTFSFKN